LSRCALEPDDIDPDEYVAVADECDATPELIVPLTLGVRLALFAGNRIPKFSGLGGPFSFAVTLR
jgi:hypothetical protein